MADCLHHPISLKMRRADWSVILVWLTFRKHELTWSLIFYEKYSTSLSTIVLVVFTTANFGGFSNFCRYYTRSQTGKSTGYRPTLKPLQKRTCQAPTHLANSSSKCARGIQASRCKEFWLKSRTFLPVGAGKNLINRKSLCTLKRGRVYIKACK